VNPTILRPKRSSFLFQQLSGWCVFCGIVAFAASVGLFLAGLASLIPLVGLTFAALVGFGVLAASVAYKKEIYQVFPGYITASRGGLFSDQTNELEFQNVTHVRQRLPWIRYRFFKVGDVIVESAGSSASEVVFRSVRDPDGLYAMLQEKLRDNGYALSKAQLLHEEQPAPVGVFLEVIGLGVGIAFGFFGVVLAGVAELSDGSVFDAGSFGKGGQWDVLFTVATFAIPILAIFASLAAMVLRYLDLRRRTYQVFNDTVVYTEGFLSRTNAFIPYENIADANIAQTLIDQVLGLYDVKISCQGSGQDIKFRRLKRGEALRGVIAQLVVQANAAERAKSSAAAHKQSEGSIPTDGSLPGEGASLAVPDPAAHQALPAVPPAEAWTATIKPSVPRALASVLILFPLFPIFVAAAIATGLAVGARTYTIGRSSAGIRAGIFNKVDREYAYDKVTGAVVKRGPLDRAMGTITVELWSIGSPIPLTLSHVLLDQMNVAALLRQVGIEETPPSQELPSQFNVSVWLRTALGLFIIAGLLMLGSAVAAFAAEIPSLMLFSAFPPILLLAYYVYRQAWCERQQMTFHPRHAELRTGLWWKDEFYTAYRNIKKVQTTRYPWSAQGALKLFVAGERIVQDNNSGQAGATLPYSFDVAYVTQVEGLGAWLDGLLQGAEDAGELERSHDVTTHLTAQPHVPAGLVPVAILSLFLLPLAPLLVGWSYVSLKRRRYVLQDDRVLLIWGVLFRSEASVLYARIDSMQKNQGALGKMFGVGNVTLFTAGSSRPDLALFGTKDYDALYSAIRARYGGGR
jgi:membrane protein YdbS with pleckstrin-like domain